MLTDKQRKQAIRDQLKSVRERVDKQVDRDIVGARFYRALLAESVVNWLAQIGNEASGETLRTIISECHRWMYEVAP